MITASIIAPILRVMTPILLCALGGVYSERSGTGNITYEGSMLVGTFTGVVGSYFTGSALVGCPLCRCRRCPCESVLRHAAHQNGR